MCNTPKANIDILVVKDTQILLGLLSNKWLYKEQQVYGVPGRDINFKETFGRAVKRNIQEEIGCKVTTYSIICVNANYEFNNHYIGIGAIAEIAGEVQNLKSEDWDRWEWFNNSNLPNNLFPAAENLIKCYLEKKVSVSE